MTRKSIFLVGVGLVAVLGYGVARPASASTPRPVPSADSAPPSDPATTAPPSATPALLSSAMTVRMNGDQTVGTLHIEISNGAVKGPVVVQLFNDETGQTVMLNVAGATPAATATVNLNSNAVIEQDVQAVLGSGNFTGHLVLQPLTGPAITATVVVARSPSTSWLWMAIVASTVLSLVGACRRVPDVR